MRPPVVASDTTHTLFRLFWPLWSLFLSLTRYLVSPSRLVPHVSRAPVSSGPLYVAMHTFTLKATVPYEMFISWDSCILPDAYLWHLA